MKLFRMALPVLAGLMLVACGAPESTPPVPRPVMVRKVVVGSQSTPTVYAGEIKARTEADLGFRIPGKLLARAVDVGARVHRGQVLARLDPADVVLQAEASRSQVAAAQTEHDFARAEYERYSGLHEQRFVSRSALDGKRTAFDAARARLEQAQAQSTVSGNQRAYAVLTADADGVVTAVSAEPGQVVAAGQAIVRVAHLAGREVAISVPENRIEDLKRAANIVVALWANADRTYAGRVREIAPAGDATTRTFAVRIAIDDPDPGVRWGMTANVLVVAPAGAPGVLLPLTSVYQSADRPAVWVFDPATGKVGLRAVTVGAYREDGVLITDGLAGDEWVVTAGVHKLVPGQVVRVWDAPVPGPERSSPSALEGLPAPAPTGSTRPAPTGSTRPGQVGPSRPAS